MNFSIHLPHPLMAELERFTGQRKLSRSGVIKEAVEQYLKRHSRSEWPEGLDAFMKEGLKSKVKPQPSDEPDFAGMHNEMNSSMGLRPDMAIAQ